MKTLLFTFLMLVVLAQTWSQVHVDESQNVGIKTPTPQAELDVNGKIKFNSLGNQGQFILGKDANNVITTIGLGNGLTLGEGNLSALIKYETKICLNEISDFSPANPTSPTNAEIVSWANNHIAEDQRKTGSLLVFHVLQGGTCSDPDFAWIINDGTSPVTNILSPFFNNSSYFLSPSANDLSARFGNPRRPYKEQAVAFTQAKTLGSTAYQMEFSPGRYFLDENLYPLISPLYSWAADGDNATYILNRGTKIVGALGGRFGFTGTVDKLTHLSILGSGTLHNKVTSTNTNPSIAIYSNTHFKLDLDTFIFENNTTGGNEGCFKIDAVDADINIKNYHSYVNGNISGPEFRVGTWSASVLLTPCRINLNVGSILKTANGNESALFNIGRPDNSKPKVELNFHTNINKIEINGVGTTRSIFYSIGTLKNSIISTKINSIRNTSFNPQGPLNDFKLFQGSWGEIDIFGSSGDISTNVKINIDAGIVNTNFLVIKLQNAHLTENSVCDINVENGTSPICCIDFSGMSLDGSSKIRISGNYLTTGQNHCVNVGIVPPLNSSDGKVYLSGRYETLGQNEATVQIAAGIRSEMIYLENCTLINNGSVPNIITNSGSPITVVCKNVYMNSILNDPNINLVGTYYQNAIYK